MSGDRQKSQARSRGLRLDLAGLALLADAKAVVAYGYPDALAVLGAAAGGGRGAAGAHRVLVRERDGGSRTRGPGPARGARALGGVARGAPRGVAVAAVAGRTHPGPPSAAVRYLRFPSAHLVT